MLALSSQSSHQLPGVYAERLGDAQDVVQGQVALAALDLADEGPVQVAVLGQRFLGLAQLVSSGAYPCSELASGGRDGRLGRGTRHLAISSIPALCVQRLCISSKYVLCCDATRPGGGDRHGWLLTLRTGVGMRAVTASVRQPVPGGRCRYGW